MFPLCMDNRMEVTNLLSSVLDIIMYIFPPGTTSPINRWQRQIHWLAWHESGGTLKKS